MNGGAEAEPCGVSDHVLPDGGTTEAVDEFSLHYSAEAVFFLLLLFFSSCLVRAKKASKTVLGKSTGSS